MTRTLEIESERPLESVVDRMYRSDPPRMKDSNSTDSAVVFGVVWRVLILVTFVIVTFPPCFDTMKAGLDASWAIGLNEASSRHMVYGRDIIFTYGPLGFALAPLDLGSNLVHAILFRLGLHILWWTSVGTLLFRIRGYGATLLFAAASSLSGIQFGPARDFNFGLTGVVILTTAGYLLLAHLDRRLLWALPAVIVSAAALLAKFNIGVACTGSIVVWAIIELLRDRSPRMLGRLGLLALTYVVVLGGLFRVYGGPINALGEFLRYSKEIASGYSSQMSLSGPGVEVAILAVVLGLAIIAAAGILLRASYTPALLITLFPLFVLFKGASVRRHPNHLLTYCPPMVGLAAFLLPGRIGRWRSWMRQAVVALAFLGALWFAPSSASSVLTRGAVSWVSLRKHEEVRASIRASDSKVKDQLKLPTPILSRIGSATVDVYPWDLCYITANGLNWKPRFVFQSYTAYTPALDRRCAEDYRANDAPRYIVYSHQSIDSEHPCIVDPATWMEIYRWYDVVDQAGKILLLERRVSPRWDAREELGSRLLTFGQRWEVPQDIQGPVILRASLRLNLVGKLYSLLYKVYPPTIRVEYRDGGVMDYRLVWQNVKSGFLVSSLPRDVDTQRRFFEGGEAEADGVRSITFLDDNGCFVKGFHVTWLRESRSTPSRSRELARPVASIESKTMTR
jgi:hypothetical protein